MRQSLGETLGAWTLVAGIPTEVEIDLSGAIPMGRGMVQLSLQYELRVGEEGWRPIHEGPHFELWSGVAPAPSDVHAVVEIPLYPFPAQTRLFETRWAATLTAVWDGIQGSEVRALGHGPLSVTRPDADQLDSLPGATATEDLPMRVGDVPWLASATPGEGAASVADRPLTWTPTTLRWDALELLDNIRSVQPSRAADAHGNWFLVDLRWQSMDGNIQTWRLGAPAQRTVLDGLPHTRMGPLDAEVDVAALLGLFAMLRDFEVAMPSWTSGATTVPEVLPDVRRMDHVPAAQLASGAMLRTPRHALELHGMDVRGLSVRERRTGGRSATATVRVSMLVGVLVFALTLGVVFELTVLFWLAPPAVGLLYLWEKYREQHTRLKCTAAQGKVVVPERTLFLSFDSGPGQLAEEAVVSIGTTLVYGGKTDTQTTLALEHQYVHTRLGGGRWRTDVTLSWPHTSPPSLAVHAGREPVSIHHFVQLEVSRTNDDAIAWARTPVWVLPFD